MGDLAYEKIKGTGLASLPNGILEHGCNKCRNKKRFIQRSAIHSASDVVLPIMNRMSRSPGQPSYQESQVFVKSQFDYDFSKIPIQDPPSVGNRTVQLSPLASDSTRSYTSEKASYNLLPLIQPKLTISQPEDEYEQEADRVAEQVMLMQKGHVLRRKCTKCHERYEDILQAKGVPGQVLSAKRGIDVPPIVYDVLGSPGQTLDQTIRAIMEKSFGKDLSNTQVTSRLQKSRDESRLYHQRDLYWWDEKRFTDSTTGDPLQSSSEDQMSFRRIDFSKVRIHTDDKAAESAKAINASAYTVGTDIVFGASKYEPRKYEGQRLLAHELTHVVQQGGTSYENDSKKLPAHEMVHKVQRQGVLQNKVIQRDNDGSGGHEGSSGSPPASESGPEPDIKTDSAPPVPDEEPRSLKETLNPRNMKRDEIQHEISTIDQWLNKSRPDENEADSEPLTAAREALEKELATTGGRCDPPKGKGHQPDTVRDVLIERLMGKYAKIDKDPGEGCIPYPYIAGVTESVCTIGWGLQIPDCPIVDKENNVLSPDERKKKNKSDLKCQCEGREHFDCKGPQGEKKLRAKVAGIAKESLKPIVSVDLTPEEYDALVDISIHVGHLPENLIEAINWYWCTPVGKNYVRSLYLNTALTRKDSSKIEENFVNRRKLRVWSEYDTSEQKKDTD